MGKEFRSRYWWVCQNTTFRHDLKGGYLWCPKRNAAGKRNPFFECMKEVRPGDVVFSYHKAAIGIACSVAYDSRRPDECGNIGPESHRRNPIGWRVRVCYHRLKNRISPKEHIEALRSLLPSRYSPLRENGDGNRVYLAKIPDRLGRILAIMFGDDFQPAC